MKNRLLVLIGVFFLLAQWACSPDQQDSNRTKGAALKVEWKLISNIIGEDAGHRAVFTLTNTSASNLGDDWALFFNMTPRAIDTLKTLGDLHIEWINGDLYRLVPKTGFQLVAGASTTLTYEAGFWMIKEGDAPTGLYLVQAEGETDAITSINNYTVHPFTTKEQTSRHKNDRAIIPDATTRFREAAAISKLDETAILPIIPSPKSVQLSGAQYTLENSISIAYDPAFEQEANYLEERLKAELCRCYHKGRRPGRSEHSIEKTKWNGSRSLYPSDFRSCGC